VDWLIDETSPLTVKELTASLPDDSTSLRGANRANLAVRLNDLVVHDTRKRFGGARVRLDAIVVHGVAIEEATPASFYQPTTFRFEDVRDGDRLPIEAPGLLTFYGRPRHFIDISITMSRDTDDAGDLSDLIATGLNSSEWKDASGELLGLAVAAPPAAAIVAAVGAAAVIGNLAADVLQKVTGKTIGFYRTAYLQHRDRFGLGRHPETDAFRHKDLSFWYEIVADRAAQP
jgi:hypothetical protein